MTRSDTSRSSRIVLRTPDAGPRRPDGAATGQHAAWRPVPWHQRLLVALIAGGLLAGLGIAGVRAWDVAPACVPVRVVAAPEIAPLVAQVAQQLDRAQGCAFSIVPRASTDEAQVLAGGADSAGIAEPSHVWMPESTMQLTQARARGATAVPIAGVSVVSTPVVMALAADAVGKLGPGRPTCDEVLRADKVVVGAPDPTRDPIGLAALLEAQADLGSGPDGDAALVAFLRRMQNHVVEPGDALYDRLPGAASPTPGHRVPHHRAADAAPQRRASRRDAHRRLPERGADVDGLPVHGSRHREPGRAGRGRPAARRAAGSRGAGGARGGRVPHRGRPGARRPAGGRPHRAPPGRARAAGRVRRRPTPRCSGGPRPRAVAGSRC